MGKITGIMKKIIGGVLLALLALGSCAPTRFVEPLEEKQHAVGFTFGGPLIEFGGTIPVPLSGIQYGYGIKKNLTAFGALHTTSAVFGNLQLDAGVTYQFLEQKGAIPNLSVTPALNFITNFQTGTTRLWPQVDVNAFWHFSQKKHFVYAGLGNWFVLSGKRAHNEPSLRRWVMNPQIGATFKLGESWMLTAETKFLAPLTNKSMEFVPYQSVFGNYGATGAYIGITKTF